MSSRIFILLFFVTTGCSGKKHSVGVPEKLSHKSRVTQAKAVVETPNLLNAARSRFPNITYNSPDDIQGYVDSISEYSGRIADAESLTKNQALSELFNVLTEHATKSSEMRFGRVFSEIVFGDPRGIATALSELPAGPLRQVCISYLRGKNLEPDALADVYHAMPESADRSKIANRLVSQSYNDKGVESALNAIQSLETEEEKRRAYLELAGNMFGSYSLKGKTVTGSDIAKVRASAKAAGHEDQVGSLTGIKTEMH